ncbi:uncharacterized protein LOC128213414 isoform X2 [Mya arenaria]|uniref:uncharacterized protein LOC128213414 isoform X2 n=1 Tax=Mya arenaria TaxID=6604 RepID=UPI0022E149E1|nr:uncharacterized protein LOC128213414 isoform X2 [Mya arenaria]
MERRICEFRPEIVQCIKTERVLQHLVPSFITQGESRVIKRLYKISTERANNKLLDNLLLSTSQGKWVAFIDALRREEYIFLEKLLNCEDTLNKTNYRNYRRIIELFAPTLKQQIEPSELTTFLVADRVISDVDQEEIIAEQQNHGCIAATVVLLDRIKTHLNPDEWYQRFLLALYKNGQSSLVKDVDPDFYWKHQTEETIERTVPCDKGSVNTERAAGEMPEDAESNIAKRIIDYWSEIVEIVDIDDLNQYLNPDLLDEVDGTRIRGIEPEHTGEALSKLLHKVIGGKVCRTFLCVLVNAGYPFLASFLKSDSDNSLKTSTYLRNLIQIFSSRVQNQLDVNHVLSDLVAESVISQTDNEKIKSVLDLRGNTAAAMELLDRIHKRLEPCSWYSTFLQILVRRGHAHIVKIIEPDYLENQTNFREELRKIESNLQEDLAFSFDSPSDKTSLVKAIKKRIHNLELSKEEALISIDKWFLKLQASCEETKREVSSLASSEHESLQRVLIDVQGVPSQDDQFGTFRDRCYEQIGTLPKAILFENSSDLILFGGFGTVSLVENRMRENERLPIIDNRISREKKLSNEISRLKLSYSPSSSSSFLKVKGNQVRKTGMAFHEASSSKSNSSQGVFGRFQLLKSIESNTLLSLSFTDAVIDANGHIVAFCTTLSSFFRIGFVQNQLVFRDVIQYEHNCEQLCLLDKNVIGAMTSKNKPLVTIGGSCVELVLKWECVSPKQTIAAAKDKMLVLCSGKHIHVYKLSEFKQDEVNLGGIPISKDWNPSSAVLNTEESQIIVAENGIFCFDLLNGVMLWQWSEKRQPLMNHRIFRKISFFDKFVVIAHSSTKGIGFSRLDIDEKHVELLAENVCNFRANVFFENCKNGKLKAYLITKGEIKIMYLNRSQTDLADKYKSMHTANENTHSDDGYVLMPVCLDGSESSAYIFP